MLESLNLVSNYTQIFSFRKYTFCHQDCLNFAYASILAKESAFVGKNSTFTQAV